LDFILRSVFYKTRENDFSENGYVSVFKWGEEIATLLGLLERGNPNHWTT
jgi:hypothetical protein